MYLLAICAACGAGFGLLLALRHEKRNERYRDWELRLKCCGVFALLFLVGGSLFGYFVVRRYVAVTEVTLAPIHLATMTSADGRDGLYVIGSSSEFVVKIRANGGEGALFRIPNDSNVYVTQTYAIVGDGILVMRANLRDPYSPYRNWAIGVDYSLQIVRNEIQVPLFTVAFNVREFQ